jgi:hypothetical protein
MRNCLLMAAAILVSTGLAEAQPPLPGRPSVESVTVTGTRSREVVQAFVESFVAPTRLTGKIARWEDGVCPVTVGLRPTFTKFVTDHVKEVASSVGAPVNTRASCKPNIEIVFTTTPQALLDGMRKSQPSVLGYYDNSAQLEKLATVTRPIQAWYTTATKDLEGKIDIDSGKTVGPGLEIWLPCPRVPGICLVTLPNARAEAVTGSRLGDGLRSDLNHIIIVADPTKLVEYEIGSLSDYIAMLALTQLSSLDTCQQLPSIVNMLATGCDKKASALTDNDLAYLRGLYKMSPDRTLRTQEDEMAYQMKQNLDGH